jgi:large subunit ribosomal protein L11
MSQIVEALVEAGKASAGPPIGSSLGPLGVNVGQVVSQINEKTASFKGMQVPVKIIVDEDTKEFEISIGTPPSSSLILKETGIEKGSRNPKADKVADILIEQIIKIAKMKEDALLGKNLKQKVKEIVGTCNSMGVLVEGKPAVETIQDINKGKFDEEIRTEKTELSEEEKKKLDEEKKKLAKEIEERRAEYVATAKQIISEMAGKEKGEIKAKLNEAKIPVEIIKELMPTEGETGAAAESGEGAKEGEGEKKEEETPKEEKKEEKK